MKFLISLLLTAVATFAAVEEKNGTTVQYRNGATITMDYQTTVRDEDNAWTNTWPTFSRLRYLGSLTGGGALSIDASGNITNSTKVSLTNLSAGSANISGLITNGSLTASLPVFTDTNKSLVTKTIANAKLALGIQIGTAVTTADGTVTNTFGTAFSSAPTIVSAPVGIITGGLVSGTITNIIQSITPSNFVIIAGAGSITSKWIAVGAP